MLTMLCGCVKNEFAVDFSLSQATDRTYRVLYYATGSSKGWIVESVVSVEGGKARLNGVTRNPTLVYIFAGGKSPVSFFYAERGDRIEITGDGADPSSWNVDGNKINRQLSDWRRQNAKILKDWRTGNSKGVKAVNAAVAKYVKANPSDPVSALLLLEYYDRSSDEEGFYKTWQLLKGEATNGKWRELVSRSDMYESPSEVKLPKQFVFSLAGGGRDTIVFGRVPVLLNFSRSNVDEYLEEARTLRELAEESGDSTQWRIANVLFDPDSLQRVQTARRDSLRGVADGWMPLGFSDSRIKDFGVRSIPTLIVVDAGGKIVYRGEEMSEAVLSFKKLLEK